MCAEYNKPCDVIQRLIEMIENPEIDYPHADHEYHTIFRSCQYWYLVEEALEKKRQMEFNNGRKNKK